MGTMNSGPYQCDNCGDVSYGPLLGGECVSKCSESVDVSELVELVEDFEQKDTAGFIYAAEMLREVIERESKYWMSNTE